VFLLGGLESSWWRISSASVFFVIGGECCQEREKVAFDDAKVALNDIATGQSPSREMGFSEKWGIPFIVDFPIKNGDFP
jgi:hypothetical protein